VELGSNRETSTSKAGNLARGADRVGSGVEVAEISKKRESSWDEAMKEKGGDDVKGAKDLGEIEMLRSREEKRSQSPRRKETGQPDRGN